MGRASLFMPVSEHHIWKNIDLWEKIIDTVVNIKIEKNCKQQRKSLKTIPDQTSASTCSEDDIPSMILSKKDYDNEEVARMTGMIVTGVLQQFVHYMIKYKIDMDECKKLLFKYTTKYKINGKLFYEMILELQIQKKLNIKEVKKSEKYLMRSMKLIQLYNGNKLLMVISLLLPSLDCKTLRNLLILNKDAYRNLNMDVFKHVLANYNLTLALRVQIWSRILNIVFLF